MTNTKLPRLQLPTTPLQKVLRLATVNRRVYNTVPGAPKDIQNSSRKANKERQKTSRAHREGRERVPSLFIYFTTICFASPSQDHIISTVLVCERAVHIPLSVHSQTQKQRFSYSFILRCDPTPSLRTNKLLQKLKATKIRENTRWQMKSKSYTILL